MKHSIPFINTENTWDNALPLGNGVFGAMLYYEDGKLNMPFNHYEVYYNIEKNVLPADKLSAYEPYGEPGTYHREREERAELNLCKDEESFIQYMGKKEFAFSDNFTGAEGFSGSYPSTGNLVFGFSDKLKECEHNLTLYVEDAKCTLEMTQGDNTLAMDTIIARKDCIINHIVQSENDLLHFVKIDFPPYRDIDYPDISYAQEDKTTFTYTVEYMLDENTPFAFSGCIKLVGAEGKLVQEQYGAVITIENAEKEFCVMTSVVTEWKTKSTREAVVEFADECAKSIDNLYTEHKKYWKEFFGRSNISIPDKFLEHIYYVNQYALDCCSGKDGVMKHHACGLNGLWDVRHPNLWGSMWYWDVNIQAAFAGVFSSNRLDLAKVFSDGLLTYVDLAKKWAEDMHACKGIGGDYPYPMYFSVWPWCAQYLWFLYEYSMDKKYLEETAFPVFVGLCEFYLEIFKYDSDRGYYSVYPDISPEQGPLAHDSIITVASVKYLFKFTLEAAGILGIDMPMLSKCREVMENMAPYPISEDGLYGVHLRDSHDAPDNLWIRHPSMLMPLFPIGELNVKDEKIHRLLSNTVDYLDERCEIGIFGGSWIAAAAARLGRGQAAIRLLYERGIDHMLRSNGLTAEETDHFINYCLNLRQPLYYPCMMEFTGEMLVAVNEMLIQSHGGVINVFPAMPDGDMEYERLHRHGYPLSDWLNRYTVYEKWNDVSFDKLLAKGAFEISASLEGGKLKYIKVLSKAGGRVNVTSPFINETFGVSNGAEEIPFDREGNVISFDTTQGEMYVISCGSVDSDAKKTDDYSPAVLAHRTYTKRKIYLGEDSESKYQKAVDYFIRDWYVGNVRMTNHLVYKFDMTKSADKSYKESFFRMFYGAEERMGGTMAFNTFANDSHGFTHKRGFGFSDASAVSIVERNIQDPLRRDFAEGSESVEFIIEAPRGQYELFVVSGDAMEDSVTVVEAVNGRKAGGEVVKKGEYQCKLLPLVNEKDEPIRLKISTKAGYKWKVNYIMLNAVKGY